VKGNRFFLIRILEVLTRRIKTKVVVFEIFIILFVSLSIGYIVVYYMGQTLTEKAHQFSERIVRDLAKSIEYNYISLPAVDEAVNAFSGTKGILYLGYHGYIISKDLKKVDIYIGQNITNLTQRELDLIFKDINGFTKSKETIAYSKNLGQYIWSHITLVWNIGVDFFERTFFKNNLVKEKSRRNLTRPGPEYFEYYMPVVIHTGKLQKKIGNVLMRYSVAVIKEEIERVTFLIEVITAVVVVIGIYISIGGANSIVRPIVRLTNIVQRFGEGDLTVRANMPVKDEIGVLANAFDRMMISIREKLEMQKFVSDSTVKMIKKSVTEYDAGSIGKERVTERKVVTLFFSDIRGFTSMSEKMDPKAVVDMLNEYLDVQSNIIKNYGGDIDKFVGDEIVAVFESENMCRDAISAAIEAQKKIGEMNRKRMERNLEPVKIGIGINTGEVVKGSIGSHERMDFTVIGDNVNLASRLCSVAGGGEIIISRSVYDKLDKESRANIKPMRPIRVKGKLRPVEVYRVEY